MLMGNKEIQEILPHRHPFLLVDCIEELWDISALHLTNPTSEDIFRRIRLCRGF